MVFAAVVLLVALPWTTLLNEHTQLSSATAETNQLQVENKALAAQAKELSSAATQSALARQDYGLVRPGQTAYDILPPPGAVANEAIQAGHVPLDEAPVVPGSRRSQELLGAGVVNPTSAASTSPGSTAGSTTPAITPAGSRSSSSTARSAPARLPTGGFWSRVGATLEFWN
jgi:septum formation initiator